jgi:D-glycero-alpha-D-manno-heptose 1-phosphate guanylyltransferase
MLPPATAAAIVLAGGAGTRVQHLYPDLPKPVIPVCGRPFLEWVCRFWVRSGIRRLVISVGYKAQVAESRIAEWRWPGIEITSVRESTPLGTGGAVRFAAANVPDADPLVILNGDSLAVGPIGEIWRMGDDPRTEGVVVGVAVEDASRYGTLRLGQDGRLLGFEEKRPGKGWVNAGTYIFPKHVLSLFPAASPLSMEYDVLPRLLARGLQLRALCMEGDFLDIGTPESLARAESFIRTHRGELEF